VPQPRPVESPSNSNSLLQNDLASLGVPKARYTHGAMSERYFCSHASLRQVYRGGSSLNIGQIPSFKRKVPRIVSMKYPFKVNMQTVQA
jgi:hypothetical protein